MSGHTAHRACSHSCVTVRALACCACVTHWSDCVRLRGTHCVLLCVLVVHSVWCLFFAHGDAARSLRALGCPSTPSLRVRPSHIQTPRARETPLSPDSCAPGSKIPSRCSPLGPFGNVGNQSRKRTAGLCQTLTPDSPAKDSLKCTTPLGLCESIAGCFLGSLRATPLVDLPPPLPASDAGMTLSRCQISSMIR